MSGGARDALVAAAEAIVAIAREPVSIGATMATFRAYSTAVLAFKDLPCACDAELGMGSKGRCLRHPEQDGGAAEPALMKRLADMIGAAKAVRIEDTEGFKEIHAAGYAEAVGDIRQMVADERDEDQEALSWVIRRLDRGAHVGAAKKGGAT